NENRRQGGHEREEADRGGQGERQQDASAGTPLRVAPETPRQAEGGHRQSDEGDCQRAARRRSRPPETTGRCATLVRRPWLPTRRSGRATPGPARGARP